MNKQLISMLLAACATSLHGADKPAALPEITIHGEHLGLESTLPSESLTGDALSRNRSATLGETMGQIPGVHNADGSAGSSRPVIRGLGGHRIRILEGGSGVFDASTLSPDHNVAVEPFRAEEVEVLKGPATLLYGSGAVAGVVNVVTALLKPDPIDGVETKLGVGVTDANQKREGWGKLRGGNGDFAVYTDFLYRDTGEYKVPGFADIHGDDEPDAVFGKVSNSQTTTRSGSVGLSWTPDHGYLGLGVSHYNTLYGVPSHEHDEGGSSAPAEPPAKPTVSIEQTRIVQSGHMDPDHSLFKTLHGNGVYSDFQQLESDGKHSTEIKNRALELSLRSDLAAIGAWHGSVGVLGIHSDYSQIGEEAYVPRVNSNLIGGHILQEYRSQKWAFNIGGRWEYAQHKPSGTQPTRDFQLVSLITGGRMFVTPWLTARGSFGLSQRAPDIQELYSNGPHLATGTFEVGDNTLKVEQGQNTEVELVANQGGLRVSIGGFYTDWSNFVFASEVDDGTGKETRVDEDGTPTANGELLKLQFGQSAARFWGLEAQTSYDLSSSTSASMFFDMVRATTTGGRKLPRIPADRFGLRLDHQIHRWALGVQNIWVAPQNMTAPLETATGGYTLLSADVGLRLMTSSGEWKISLRGENLLDELARNHVSFFKEVAPLPGRTIHLGVNWSF